MRKFGTLLFSALAVYGCGSGDNDTVRLVAGKMGASSCAIKTGQLVVVVNASGKLPTETGSNRNRFHPFLRQNRGRFAVF